ncbi:melibiose permease [Lachnospiraceae bacterium XBB1006]|nr:melibiose permease [Lachnospiraceae bacterium XBB1006]
MEKKSLSAKEKVAYGIGAVGKDMVYMLSATYILYYYQDIMGVSSWAMGIILLVARVFDAFNDPIMGVLVAKTQTKFGKFRPWLLIGTLTNAVVLYLMFAAPPALNGSGMVAYAAVTYILWGVTYTMMDIPFWSMIPAFTEAGKEREGVSAMARSCAGVGSAIITIVTVKVVTALGEMMHGSTKMEVERLGYQYFALVVAVLFVVFIVITCLSIKEKSNVDVQATSVGEMFKALVANDQAMTMVIAIVLINTAVYVTSNLVIYFFKYDFSVLSTAKWQDNYTLFNIFGGGFQILAMMLLFPLLRKFMNCMKIFVVSLSMALLGYVSLLVECFSGVDNVYFLLLPAFLIMGAVGLLNVLITVFLANSVDYGEYKNNRRDESVIFSMQTFVVKLASGIAAWGASMILGVFHISSDENAKAVLSESTRIGFRMCMVLIPMALLIIGWIVFKRHYILTDEKLAEISGELEERACGGKHD